MNKIKTISIFGTRPEAIKMLPLTNIMKNDKTFISKILVTAQHREMLDQVLDVFNVTPDFDLNIMKNRQTLVDITSNVLINITDILKHEKPDLVLVHGDTTTSFAASLAAFYEQIPIAHVEAGLRTYNKYEPFPEEINRVLTDRLTDIYLSPTKTAHDNLIAEGIKNDHIYITGNTVCDAFKTTLNANHIFKDEAINRLDFTKKVIVITAHRRENIGENLINICNALKEISNRYDDVYMIYAVHKNPAVRETVYDLLGNFDKIILTEPLELTDMHNLMARCYFIMTDSGGIQEEAPTLGKPVLVLRNVTERPEGIIAGTLKLAGTDTNTLITLASELIENGSEYRKMANAKNPFGDGNASKRIVECIKHYFGLRDNKPEDFRV